MVLVVAACGPSSQEIATAKTARYQGSRTELYSIAKQVTADDYRIGEEDPPNFRFATQPQWYSPEGGRQSNGAGDFVNLDDRSVQLMLVVEIVELLDRDQNEWGVTVAPITFQHINGSPKPRLLAPDDPNLPPWILGRVDSLVLDIHKHAKGMLIR